MRNQRKVDALFAYLYISAPAEHGDHSHYYYGEGIYFDAARGRAGASADKHQYHRQKVSAVGERSQVYGIETCRSRSCRVKERNQPFFAQSKVFVCGVGALEEEKQHGGNDQEQSVDQQNDFGIEAEFFDVAFGVDDVAPNAKAQTADDDQERDRQGNQRVGRVAGQRNELFVRKDSAHQIEAGVAKRRNRMPDGVVDTFSDSEVGDKAYTQQKRSRGFDHGGAQGDPPDESAHAAEAVFALGEHKRFTFVESQIATDRAENYRHEGHKTQTARLDQEKDDDLSEQRPMDIGVVRSQPGYAGRGSGGKKCVNIGSGLSVARGERQHQQQTSRDDNDEVSERQELPDSQFSFRFQLHNFLGFRGFKRNRFENCIITGKRCQANARGRLFSGKDGK